MGGDAGCDAGCEVCCDASGEAAAASGAALGDAFVGSGLAVGGGLGGTGIALLALVIAGRFAGILLALGARFSLGLGGCVGGGAGGLVVPQVSCSGPGVFAASGRSAVIARPAQASVWIAAETANAGQRRVVCSR